MVHPKKRLGQHFLTDPAIAERIVRLVPEEPDIRVVEIGPGKGILTEFLLTMNSPLQLIEIDSESVQYLINRYPRLHDSILEKDFLKLPDSFFDENPTHIVGNFPYNISTQIFFKVLEHRKYIKSVTCMLQKEVAQRIQSPPGSKVYGILSVLLQAYFSVKFHFNVKPGSFFPPPKVTSSVITLTRNDTLALKCNENLFFRVVKTTFNQRRKTIRNSLKTILLNLRDDFELLGKRPEQLSVDEFVELTNWVEPRLNIDKNKI